MCFFRFSWWWFISGIEVSFYVCFARLPHIISSIVLLSPFHDLLYWSFVTPQSGKSPEASTLLPTLKLHLTSQLSEDYLSTLIRERNLKTWSFSWFRENSSSCQIFVIWHDVLKNSVTPHPSSGNRPLTSFQLIKLLGQRRERFAALIFCQRTGTTCIEFELRQTGILVINVKKHLLSKRLRMAFSQEIRQLHLFVAME